MSIDDYYTKGGRRRWRVRVYDPIARRPVHVGVRDTKREAVALEAQEIARRSIPTAERVTVSKLRDLWLDVHPVSEQTKAWHRERTKLFAETHGHRQVSAIGHAFALEWYARHPSSVQVLSALWTFARSKRLATIQPWEGLTARGKGRQLEPGWMVESDVQRLADAAVKVHTDMYGSVVAAMILTGAYVGLRPGELAGLRWVDLRPDEGMLTVAQQANAKLRTFTLPKGGKPREAVYPRIARDAIERMPRLHDELVFTTARGGVLWPEARDRIWKPVRAGAGRYTMDLHELRHYCATWLVEQGISDSDAADQLGHQDGGVQIRRTYSHPRRRIALGRVAAALSKLDDGDVVDERATA